MKFTWYGKENAIIESMTPSTGTLRPDKDSSKNWDDTENLYIEGDNLEVLKLLQKSYFGKVKMIYIDSPYNTGNDFVYKDNFRDNIANYKEITNQITKANPETNGRYHTDWLNMIYPRLKLAKNLLKEDGVIFISIDDNEVDNLKKICTELFGDDNVEQLIWQKTDSRVDKNTNSKQINRIKGVHEYIIICYKNKSKTFFQKMLKFPDWKNSYTNPDKDLRGPYKQGIISFTEGHKKEDKTSEYYYSIKTPSGRTITRHWFITKDEFLKKQKDNRIYFPNNGDGIPAEKVFENEEKEYYMESILRGVGTSSSAKDELMEVVGNRSIFETPKPIKLLMELTRISTKENDIILDFFGGSCSTAHAVIKLNDEDNGNRKFIMIQLPEVTDEKSEAYKAGYKNICEIGKERIRRAGDKIVSENKDKEGIEKLDIGFKVFKLEYNCGGENYSIMEEGIKVDIIKRPKDKPICKFKVCGELYYLVKTNEDIIVFPYKSSIKGKAIASIFNIELCKDRDYMQLEYLYNMKLNEFNDEDFIHSQYVTSVILDNVYKNLIDLN